MSIFVDIEKRLGDFHLKVNFRGENETLALLGASGCGKSMTLRCIAGIQRPDRGRIEVDGIAYFDSDKGIDLPPQQRRTGLMFQSYALFPNMSVIQNIRCGAKREKDRSKREAMVQSVIEGFGLTELTKRLPCQLSGGQQQRVALARILVSAPRILLLDEPFSALDSHLRFQMEQDVRRVIREFGKTVILVSHDRDEVFRMADSIALMEQGTLTAFGRKKDVFKAPVTRQGAMLTGCKNVSKARQLPDGRVLAQDWGIALELPSAAPDYVGIRMHDITQESGENRVLCRVTEVIENPFSYTVMLKPAGGGGNVPLGWELDKEKWQTLRREEIEISLPADKILLLRE